MNTQPGKRILLIQLFSNGDILYATTIARQIKQDNPGCFLVWLVADYCKPILLNNPFIDEIITIAGFTHANWEKKLGTLKKQLHSIRQEVNPDEVVFPQLFDRNYANYDYCIRSAIFRGYKHPITVPVQPVLRLTDEEMLKVRHYAELNNLTSYRHVVLFEFSPRSGQSDLTAKEALEIANKLTQDSSVCMILSSNLRIDTQHPGIIDGSQLSLRETAQLTHYCTLLLGCSSGITWVSTSQAAKTLPMVQVLNPQAYWLNSVVNDHRRFALPTDHIIEVTEGTIANVSACLQTIFEEGFAAAKERFHCEIPKQFRITRGIIVYLLARGDIRGVIKHIRINLGLFGWHPLLLRSIFLGIVLFPVMVIKKRIDTLRKD